MEEVDRPVIDDEIEFWRRANITARDLAVLRARLRELETRVAYMDTCAGFHPRAWGLMSRKQNFVVVSEEELYFESVYRTIRIREIGKRTWTQDDERDFEASMQRVYALYEVGIRKQR